ncbi:MAG: hypothetical protein DRJ05_01465 [Bacteroidetes bacterium]|nr:MAG: hypothetical protein DRJ05_01465 [Bacteroidota bacterium]
MHTFIHYLHILGIMLLMGSLMAEYLIAKTKTTNESVRMLSIANSIFLISLVVVLISGLFRWFVFGKGNDFYMTNPFFHTKLTLYIILAIIAFFPSRKINKWKKQLNNDSSFLVAEKENKSLFLLFRIEFVLIIIIPLLAVLVARGTY